MFCRKQYSEMSPESCLIQTMKSPIIDFYTKKSQKAQTTYGFIPIVYINMSTKKILEYDIG